MQWRTEKLKLYWAKASTGLSYPSPWTGGVYHPATGAEMGQPIGTFDIPVLQPGQETSIKKPWIVPNPANYETGEEQWHFCLLSRIESAEDPISVTETTDLNANVRNNNNFAWKNITVVDLSASSQSGTVAIANPFNTAKNYYLELLVDDMETGKPVYEEAEVSLKMDDTLYNAWQREGAASQKISPTLEEHKKLVTGNKVIMENIAFNPKEIGILRLDFNFLTQQMSDKTNYRYHTVQRETGSGNIIGGETYHINKNARAIFNAESVEALATFNQPIAITAKDINEPAVYKWYDNEGNFINEEKTLNITNAKAETYRLEVISLSDGYKDYADVDVKLKPNTLGIIAPNPASNNITVNYELNGANTAFLMLVKQSGNNQANYILDTDSNQININNR